MGFGLLGLTPMNEWKEKYLSFSLNCNWCFWWHFYWDMMLGRRSELEKERRYGPMSSNRLLFPPSVVVVTQSSLGGERWDGSLAKGWRRGRVLQGQLVFLGERGRRLWALEPLPQRAFSLPWATFAVRVWFGGLFGESLLRWECSITESSHWVLGSPRIRFRGLFHLKLKQKQVHFGLFVFSSHLSHSPNYRILRRQVLLMC